MCMPELTHIKRSADLRTVSDASRAGLGAVLPERENLDVWTPIYFASRFAANLESKNSTIELESLVVV